MTKVVECRLPNGAVPFQNISDSRTRDAVMKISENIKRLCERYNELARAFNEAMRK